MEFGALQCKPFNPDCYSCCLMDKCVAKKTDSVHAYPLKTKKAKQTDRYFNYIILVGDRGTFYQQRSDKDIWQNMYEPLLIESKKLLGKSGILKSQEWLNIFGNRGSINLVQSESMVHKLTHQTIRARFWEAKVDSSLLGNSRLEEFEDKDLKDIPIPRLIEKYLALRQLGERPR